VGFEPTISAGERPQTYALDRAATGSGYKKVPQTVIFVLRQLKEYKNAPGHVATYRNFIVKHGQCNIEIKQAFQQTQNSAHIRNYCLTVEQKAYSESALSKAVWGEPAGSLRPSNFWLVLCYRSCEATYWYIFKGQVHENCSWTA